MAPPVNQRPPPIERRKWPGLNAAQKIYSYVQYNKSRARAGLAYVKFPENEVQNLISDKLKNYASHVTSTTTAKPPPITTISSLLDPELNELIENDQGLAKALEFISANDPVKNYVSSGGGSKRQRVDTEDPKEGTSRTHPTVSPETTKEPSTEGTTTSTPTSMVLPGTGRDDDMEVGSDAAAGEGTAQGRGYSGGFAHQSGPITTVARPRNFSNAGGLTFEKVHRVLAYGLAPTNLAHPLNDDAASTVNIRLLTTSLMEIPWDRPFFYLSPGELTSLPIGSYENQFIYLLYSVTLVLPLKLPHLLRLLLL